MLLYLDSIQRDASELPSRTRLLEPSQAGGGGRLLLLLILQLLIVLRRDVSRITFAL